MNRLHRSAAPVLIVCLAALGEPGATALIGAKQLAGARTDEDVTEVARWIAMAANHGVVRAQTALGNLYDTGQGVPRDAGKAVGWWRTAATGGDTEAMVRLAVATALGVGTPSTTSQSRTREEPASHRATLNGEMHAASERHGTSSTFPTFFRSCR